MTPLPDRKTRRKRKRRASKGLFDGDGLDFELLNWEEEALRAFDVESDLMDLEEEIERAFSWDDSDADERTHAHTHARARDSLPPSLGNGETVLHGNEGDSDKVIPE